MQTRREFLTVCGVGALACSPGSLARSLWTGGAEATDRVLVLLRMGGGNDGLNTVIPALDDRYQNARPSLRQNQPQALPLDQDLFLHPSLVGLKSLYDEGHMAVINSVGYPNPDRSHFRSMDIWQSGSTGPAQRATGWIGRALDPLAGDHRSIPAIAVLRDELPLAMIGEHLVAPAMPSLDALALSDEHIVRISGARRQRPGRALAHVAQASDAAILVAGRIRQIAQDSRTTPADRFPGSRLGSSLATVAALLGAGLGTRAYYVAHDGFDTHTQQAGNHAALLRDLGDSVAAFFRHLKANGQARRVLLLTFSEFGRRVRENASRGTDHGAAGPLFAVSGALKPGLIGGPPDLEDLDDGDIRAQLDFRQVYATVLERWLQVESREVLSGQFEPLPFL